MPTRCALAIALVTALALPPVWAQSQAENVSWDGRFGYPLGTERVATAGGRVVAAGSFPCLDAAGAETACSLAVWEPASGWRYEAPGVRSGGSGNIHALSLAGTSVFIGGNFTAIDGQPFNYVALWNGTAWTPLGSGVDDVVYALHDHGNGLYVGGRFTQAGGRLARRVALWNGVSWAPLVDVNTGNGVNQQVNAITSNGTLVFLGGEFSSAGGVTGANLVVAWNTSSTTWDRLGTGLGHSNSVVFDLDFAAGALVAGGTFTQTGDGTMAIPSGVATWSGTAWAPAGTESAGGVLAVHGAPSGRIYARGNFGAGANGLGVWNGVAWGPVGPGLGSGGLQNGLFLAGDGETVYAGVGSLADGRSLHGLGRWDGAAWHGVGQGLGSPIEFPEVNSVLALAAVGGEVYAGGTFRSAGSEAVEGIARWDGARWSPVGTPGASALTIRALAPSGSDLYVGGSFASVGGVTAAGVARWDGAAWHALGSGTVGAVYALLRVGGDLYVGGSFLEAGGQTAFQVARWDGAAWHPLGAGIYPQSGGRVSALAWHDGQLYAGGSFSLLGDGTTTARNVAVWNGTTWAPVGAGVGVGGFEEVTALAVYGGQLHAAYRPPTSSGSPGAVHRWDGTTWTEVAQLPHATRPASVYTLLANGGDLYVGGTFTAVGGVPARGLARWNGSAWSGLGTGLSGYGESAYTLLGTSDGLWVGGHFTEAGARPSHLVGRWDDFALAPVAAEPGTTDATDALSTVRPNPSASRTTFTLTLGSPEHVRVTVHDALGREVAVVHDGLVAGERAFAFDGARLAPGVYLVRAVGATFTETRRVTVAR